jgi:two-component system sensor histidine kinase PilS (NtrC family)
LSSLQPFAAQNWRALYYFNLYRAVLSGLFIVLAWRGAAPPTWWAKSYPGVFTATVTLYFVFSIVCSFSIRCRWPSFETQVLIQGLVDILAILVMLHTSGGIDTGFGTLLVVAIAGGSILTEGRIALLFASMASLGVLAQQIYAGLFKTSLVSYAQASMLGVTFFATAILAHVLAQRLRASQDLATRRGIDLANLAQLNEHIIQRMQSGILALDETGSIRLINESARGLLGLNGRITGRRLSSLVPELDHLLEKWHKDRSQTTYFLKRRGVQVEVIASFAGMEKQGSGGTLIFLEDAAAIRQRAQKLKLASLGRLTASIAHEVRNPLGAISHASQLLGESTAISLADQRLLQIVQDNCRRMNTMVENILQLSRRKAPVPEILALKPWLEKFKGEFASQRQVPEECLVIRVEPPDLQIRMDPDQLHQIVWNLCDNAARHGGSKPRLELVAAMNREITRPYLEVIDNGKGISPEAVEHLFEPFYTTEPKGTGLGLYIARELCESNQASLTLVTSSRLGSRFRISFPDPRRQSALL